MILDFGSFSPPYWADEDNITWISNFIPDEKMSFGIFYSGSGEAVWMLPDCTAAQYSVVFINEEQTGLMEWSRVVVPRRPRGPCSPPRGTSPRSESPRTPAGRRGRKSEKQVTLTCSRRSPWLRKLLGSFSFVSLCLGWFQFSSHTCTGRLSNSSQWFTCSNLSVSSRVPHTGVFYSLTS